MDQRPIRDLRVLEAMEACRPGSDDASDPGLGLAAELAAHPEWAERVARLQKLDATLAGAIQDVPVPEGLSQRLLARLAAAQAPGAAVEAHSALPLPQASAPRLSGDRRRVAGRWVVAAAALSAAATLLLAVLWHQHGARQFTVQSMLAEAVEFAGNDTPDGGSLVAEVAPPSNRPLSVAVLATAAVRWRPVSGFLDCRGIAYDLVDANGNRATLYVVRRAVAGVPTAPPFRPALSSGNCSTSAWQEGGLLYVLVVRGEASLYDRFLDLPRGPIT
jgi:hypothetical protein